MTSTCEKMPRVFFFVARARRQAGSGRAAQRGASASRKSQIGRNKQLASPHTESPTSAWDGQFFSDCFIRRLQDELCEQSWESFLLRALSLSLCKHHRGISLPSRNPMQVSKPLHQKLCDLRMARAHCVTLRKYQALI